MSKTKEQKQKEAIERKLKHLNARRNEWLKVAYGSNVYAENEKKYGRDHADYIAHSAHQAYLRLCRECNLDDHGNALAAAIHMTTPQHAS